MFWKRFYFVAILLSCNCFLVCSNWFCKKLRNFFGCGQSETEGDINPNLNISDDNYGSLNNKGNGNSSSFKTNEIYYSNNPYDNLKGVDFSELELLEGNDIVPNSTHWCSFCSATNYRAGKTSIINKAINNKFNEEEETTSSSAEVRGIYLKNKNLANSIIKIVAWDTSSNKAYNYAIKIFCKNTIIFVYDITSKESLDNLATFINDVKKEYNENNNPLFFLLGNKLDLAEKNKEPRQVKTEDAQKFADDNGLIFLGECLKMAGIYQTQKTPVIP